jgi:hypothetical protein
MALKLKLSLPVGYNFELRNKLGKKLVSLDEDTLREQQLGATKVDFKRVSACRLVRTK